MIEEATVAPCWLHRVHTPKPLTSEWHHIVPVAWQLNTPLPTCTPPPAPGKDTDGRGMLWDTRGIWLCPTGHRNVHYWIVLATRKLAELHSETIDQAIEAIKPKRVPKEFLTAVDALTRFAPYGSFLALVAKGEWGQA